MNCVDSDRHAAMCPYAVAIIKAYLLAAVSTFRAFHKLATATAARDAFRAPYIYIYIYIWYFRIINYLCLSVYLYKCNYVYSSVAYYDAEMHSIILADLQWRSDLNTLCAHSWFCFHRLGISWRYWQFNFHKANGLSGLNAGCGLSVHIAFIFTIVVVHGCAPKEFSVSTAIPISKNIILTWWIVITYVA